MRLERINERFFFVETWKAVSKNTGLYIKFLLLEMWCTFFWYNG